MSDSSDLRRQLEELWYRHVRGRGRANATAAQLATRSFDPRPTYRRRLEYTEVLTATGSWQLAVPIEGVAARIADALRWTKPESLSDRVQAALAWEQLQGSEAHYHDAPSLRRDRLHTGIVFRWLPTIHWEDDNSWPQPISCGDSTSDRLADPTEEHWLQWEKEVDLEPIARAGVFSRSRACHTYKQEWDGVLARVWGKLFVIRMGCSSAFSDSDRIANCATRAALTEMGIVSESVGGLLVRIPSEPDEEIRPEVLPAGSEGPWMTLFDKFLEQERTSLQLSELCDEEAERADYERALADKARHRAEEARRREGWFAARDSSWEGLSRSAREDQLDRIHEKAVEVNNDREHLIDTYRKLGLAEGQWRAAFAKFWRED